MEFKTIPFAPNYEVSKQGLIRSMKTKTAIKLSGKKVELRINGEKKYFFPIECRDKTWNNGADTKPEVKKEKKPGQKKERKPKAEKVSTRPMHELASMEEVKKINAMDVFKNEAIYRFHKAGLSNEEIEMVTKSRLDVIARDIRDFKSGRKKLS